MAGGVELAGNQPGSQAPKRGAHLVAAGGEPLAHHADNPGGHAGERGGQLDKVGAAEKTAAFLGLVLPGDAEEVERIHIPQANALELLLNRGGNGLRVLHLPVGGDDDPVFLCLLDIARQIFPVHGEINHSKIPPDRNIKYAIYCILQEYQITASKSTAGHAGRRLFSPAAAFIKCRTVESQFSCIARSASGPSRRPERQSCGRARRCFCPRRAGCSKTGAPPDGHGTAGYG
ncbi:hypothetical protein SDC9_168980 [bioreactor metagenome]|uniref:Uncharacterized protein n=1 Tax=bioreactor metagenome TaxID=1076179 RepID=A0A645G6K4_9ZZZZ